MESHWQSYTKAVSDITLPMNSMPQNAPFETTSSEKGKVGFMDLLVKQPQFQARYDDMQPTWEGIQASDASISHGLFKTESMPLEQKQTPTKK
jgi:hypothetical protein